MENEPTKTKLPFSSKHPNATYAGISFLIFLIVSVTNPSLDAGTWLFGCGFLSILCYFFCRLAPNKDGVFTKLSVFFIFIAFVSAWLLPDSFFVSDSRVGRMPRALHHNVGYLIKLTEVAKAMFFLLITPLAVAKLAKFLK